MFSPLLRLLCVLIAPALSSATVQWSPDLALPKRQTEPAPGLLNDFQVYEPVLTPTGNTSPYGCVYTKVLMEHDFAFSYGQPFVGREEIHIKLIPQTLRPSRGLYASALQLQSRDYEFHGHLPW